MPDEDKKDPKDANKDPNKQEPPPGSSALSDEVQEAIGKVVNSAVTSQLKRALGPAITDAIGALKLEDMIAGSVEKIAQKLPKSAPKDDAKDTQNPASDELKRQLTDLASKLEQSEARARTAEQKQVEVEKQRQYDHAKTSLTSALKEKAHPDYLEDWVRAVEGKLTVAENGAATLKVKHIPFKGSPEVEEELPLEQAVPKLLERAEYKKYQAAPAAPEGKGGRGPRSSTDQKFSINSENPLDRVRARLQEQGMSFDEEFGG